MGSALVLVYLEAGNDANDRCGCDEPAYILIERKGQGLIKRVEGLSEVPGVKKATAPI